MDPRQRSEKKTAVLVGIAGSGSAYSLSLYNLKSYALADDTVARRWNIEVLQHPLIRSRNRAAALDRLFARIEKERPALVGFSCYLWNWQEFRELGLRVRRALPETKVVIGGPEIATDPARAGRYDAEPFDFCVLGEGERTFSELLLALDGAGDFASIPGLAYREGVGFRVNGKREPFRSLAEVPSPYLTGLVDDEVLRRPYVEASIETQRGCTLRCSYCIYHKDMSKIAYGEASRVVEEIAHCVARGVRRVRFVDANFASNLAHAKSVIRGLIERRFELKLMFELIPGFLDRELASLIAEFNAISDWNEVMLGVGVQSINQQALRTIHRAIKLEKFESTFSLMKEFGIYAKIDLIIGLPGETRASIERTLDYMMDVLRGNRAHLLCCHLMRGLPGTELLSIAKDHGMVFSSRDAMHELYESPALPRTDLLRCLRRTAIMFRMVNHEGWTRKEYIFETASEALDVHDAYFRAFDRLGISHSALLDRLVSVLSAQLPPESDFVKEDFPSAETWWWLHSKTELRNDQLVNALDGLTLSQVV